MKRKKKQTATPAARISPGTNPRLYAQTRKQLRTHYAAKYRVR